MAEVGVLDGGRQGIERGSWSGGSRHCGLWVVLVVDSMDFEIKDLAWSRFSWFFILMEEREDKNLNKNIYSSAKTESRILPEDNVLHHSLIRRESRDRLEIEGNALDREFYVLRPRLIQTQLAYAHEYPNSSSRIFGLLRRRKYWQ